MTSRRTRPQHSLPGTATCCTCAVARSDTGCRHGQTTPSPRSDDAGCRHYRRQCTVAMSSTGSRSGPGRKSRRNCDTQWRHRKRCRRVPATVLSGACAPRGRRRTSGYNHSNSSSRTVGSRPDTPRCCNPWFLLGSGTRCHRASAARSHCERVVLCRRRMYACTHRSFRSPSCLTHLSDVLPDPSHPSGSPPGNSPCYTTAIGTASCKRRHQSRETSGCSACGSECRHHTSQCMCYTRSS